MQKNNQYQETVIFSNQKIDNSSNLIAFIKKLQLFSVIPTKKWVLQDLPL